MYITNYGALRLFLTQIRPSIEVPIHTDVTWPGHRFTLTTIATDGDKVVNEYVNGSSRWMTGFSCPRFVNPLGRKSSKVYPGAGTNLHTSPRKNCLDNDPASNAGRTDKGKSGGNLKTISKKDKEKSMLLRTSTPKFKEYRWQEEDDGEEEGGGSLPGCWSKMAIVRIHRRAELDSRYCAATQNPIPQYFGDRCHIVSTRPANVRNNSTYSVLSAVGTLPIPHRSPGCGTTCPKMPGFLLHTLPLLGKTLYDHAAIQTCYTIKLRPLPIFT